LSAKAEHCLEIVGLPAEVAADTLATIISDVNEPARVGTQFVYRISVRNNGATPQRNVVLVVDVPASVEVAMVQAPAKHTQEGQTIRFEPVLSLGPNQSLSYELRVNPTRPGRAVLQASATSQDVTSPKTAERAVQIQM
jgi:uncharacterized repeat protein (TIGR01451 family)